jgi:RHS repeat-associated protein
MREGDVVYYLHGDHPSASLRTSLGSTSVASSDSGVLHSRQGYYPYGEVRYVTGELPTEFGFTGQRNDSYIKLIQMGARWYDAQIGRWICGDTVVPGAVDIARGSLSALGYDQQTRLTPLTVDFHETQFISVLGSENRELLQFGPPALWDEETRKDHPVPAGTVNPQALNRYAYCLENPLRYIDPTGHNQLVWSQSFSRGSLAYYAARFTTEADWAAWQARLVAVGTAIAVAAVGAVVDVAACAGTVGLACAPTVAFHAAVGVATTSAAYEAGGGIKESAYTWVANYINEALTLSANQNSQSLEMELTYYYLGEGVPGYYLWIEGMGYEIWIPTFLVDDVGKILDVDNQ